MCQKDDMRLITRVYGSVQRVIMAVLENEWSKVYLCVSLDDSCSFTLC